MPHILILEDERVVARDLQGILGKMGYETSLAASGEEALAVARREQLDLALVDIHLDGELDGIETARAMRQQMDLAVVYLSANADKETLDRAASTEPLGYLVKPFQEPSLRSTLQMAVRKSGIERNDRIGQRWRAAVMDQLTVGLVTVDPAGSLRLLNARGQLLSGWSEQEALGKPLTEILRLQNADRVCITADLVQRALCSKEDPEMEGYLSLVSKSGGETRVEYRVSQIHDEGQQIVGVSITFWPAHLPVTEGAGTAPNAGELDSDTVTGLPGRVQAQALIQTLQLEHPRVFAAVFVIDRYYATLRRFGAATADQVLMYYCTFLAQETQREFQESQSFQWSALFRWTGPCFLLVFGPCDCVRTAQREISPLTHEKLVAEFNASSRSVLLSISAAAKVFSIGDLSPDTLISQMDAFVATCVKSE
jgi:PAS domain S-box-containing protein